MPRAAKGQFSQATALRAARPRWRSPPIDDGATRRGVQDPFLRKLPPRIPPQSASWSKVAAASSEPARASAMSSWHDNDLATRAVLFQATMRFDDVVQVEHWA